MIIDGCYNYGTITSEGPGVGGIVGLNSANVYDCQNYGVVYGNGTCIGGIAGEVRAGSFFQGCYNNGPIGNEEISDKATGYGTARIVG